MKRNTDNRPGGKRCGGKALPGIFMALMAISASAQPPTSITACGFVINRPGNYSLDRDLTCTNAIAIGIQASQVTLTLNGHTLASGTEDFSVGVDVSAPTGAILDHVVILGPGIVRGTQGAGIRFSSSNNSEVRQVTVQGLGDFFNGIDTSRSHNLVIDSNIVGLSEKGIYLRESSLATVTNNIVSGNHSEGIDLFGATGATIAKNTVSGNGQDGILIEPGSGSGRVYENTVYMNRRNGIAVITRETSLFSNNSYGNAGVDLYDSSTCITNTWGNNTFTTKNQACIR
jgi:parallel beta-helix repeat protein